MTKSHCVTCYFWNNYLFLPTSLSSMNLHSRLAAVTDRASEREGRSRQKPWHQRKPPCEKEDWDDKENWWLHGCLCTVQIRAAPCQGCHCFPHWAALPCRRALGARGCGSQALPPSLPLQKADNPEWQCFFETKKQTRSLLPCYTFFQWG